MKVLTIIRHHFAAAAFLLLFSVGAPLWAQSPIRITIPGSAFTPQGSGTQVDDVAGARRFRSKNRDPVKFTARLQIPAPGAADPKMQRLVIHFRMGQSGGSLRMVEVLNGATPTFSLGTNLSGNYTAAEVTTPPQGANAWDLRSGPRSVGAQSIIRLTVQFPGGFEGSPSAGEFLLTSVVVDFPAKGPASKAPSKAPSTGPVSNAPPAKGPVSNAPSTPLPALPGFPAASKSVIYALNNANELVWFRHDGRSDGSFRWGGEPKTVGNGWNFKQVFSGGDGIIYGITPDGELMWFRHLGHADGSYRWTDAKKAGSGWNFEKVFSGGGGVIYAINNSGDLLWYRHDGRADGSMRWTGPNTVGNGWSLKHVFSSGDGIIYGITAAGEIMWYRHLGHADGSYTWNDTKKVGSGWNFKQVFSGGGPVIYAINSAGELLWYRHDGHADGSFRWAGEPRRVGSGWNVKEVFAEGPGS